MATATHTLIQIRLATHNDLPHLSAIEHASDQLMRQTDMHAISDLAPNPPAYYEPWQKRGHIWVAVLLKSTTETAECDEGEGNDEGREDNIPAAFISIDIHPNTPCSSSLFIHQISTHQDFARRGIGRRLIQHVEMWARDQASSIKTIDLTTFESVPWNKPYYERLGFVAISEEELKRQDMEGVRLALEKERGDEVLGRWSRVGMRKTIN